MHGEAALKSGMPDGDGGAKGGTYTFSPAHCDAVFAAFFGTDNPFEALEGVSPCLQIMYTYQDARALACSMSRLMTMLFKGAPCREPEADSGIKVNFTRGTRQRERAGLSGRLAVDRLLCADLASAFQSLKANDKLKAGKKQVHALPLTLEEVYHGCLKKVHFQRRRVGAANELEAEERELTVDVKPGLPDGTCFVFEGCAAARPLTMLTC